MSKTHPLTPYPPDSGSYGTGALNWLGLFCGSEYDWIRESQTTGSSRNLTCGLAFKISARPMSHLSASIDPIESIFTPDGTKDPGSIWKR